MLFAICKKIKQWESVNKAMTFADVSLHVASICNAPNSTERTVYGSTGEVISWNRRH